MASDSANAEKKGPEKLLQVLTRRAFAISRHGNTLVKAVDAAESAEVSTRIDRLKTIMCDIEQTFDELLDNYDLTLDEMSKQTTWFDQVENVYFHFLKLGRKFLKSCELEIMPSEPETTMSVSIDPKGSCPTAVSLDQNLMNLLSMPKLEIESFDGDPMKFHSFMRSFRLHVGNVCDNSDAKIAYLLQYTKGVAHDAIKGACIVGGDEGYQCALDTLQELFGSKHVIVQKIIQNLRDYQAVKTPEQIRQFSFSILHAYHVLADLNCMNELNAQFILGEIISKLPDSVQNRWDMQQMESKRTSKQYLNFPQLVQFVKDIADEVNDPLCGDRARSPTAIADHSDESNVTEDRASAFATVDFRSNLGQNDIQGVFQSNTQSPAPRAQDARCSFCCHVHFLANCPGFKRLSVPERTQFANNYYVCVNCLRIGHSVAQCKSSNRCFVCQEKHSAFFHVDQSID